METENQAAPGLVVLWISRDREAALNMALMYAKNSRLQGWWDRVRLLVWGPSAGLLAADPELQAEVAACAEAGVEVLACRACADRYGVAERLGELGLKVVFTGELLSRCLREDWKVVSV